MGKEQALPLEFQRPYLGREEEEEAGEWASEGPQSQLQELQA